MQSNKTCKLVEQYLGYLSVIKGRSENTIKEYRTDLLMFFDYVLNAQLISQPNRDFSCIDIQFIKTITIRDVYTYLAYCQDHLNSSPGTRARKVVSLRQFWKYLKTIAHLLENNITEELETPKLPKRIPKYLSLEESVRLLIQCEQSPRDHCIITLFLNCGLRLSELASLNIDEVGSDVISVIGKGNKERKNISNTCSQKVYQ